MNKTQEKIAAGLEQAFAERGFTELGVDGLRDAAKVSLRTLYKYCPSKVDMIIMALEHRHARYLTHLFEGLPTHNPQVLDEIFARVGHWMSENNSEGCLFHNAVVSHPNSEAIRKMLERHKAEVADKLVESSNLVAMREPLLLIHEGIVQSWPILGAQAIASARILATGLQSGNAVKV
ncbi:TetR/AcrR family transcriptional regulator [Vibrio spartinae]|uniref:HTH tetR-type domain-containing protein n=1 Tax=Vibrio spartinae TaxID=1918945 RepID=A0A1N6M3R8_9VIBR|nr:TetR/AcrR family transcriptional regulator [Vibrio spartinae]SIO94089.1 hypothetical protein VSP9026_01770 [Vibrio spartinae]